MMKMVKFSFESNWNQWNLENVEDVDRWFTCNFGLTREKKRERIYGMQISFVELKSIESAFVWEC